MRDCHSATLPAEYVTALRSLCSTRATPEPAALARPSAASPCHSTVPPPSSTAMLPDEYTHACTPALPAVLDVHTTELL